MSRKPLEPAVPDDLPGTFSPTRLRCARQRRGMTQWDLASKLGLQVRHIGQWERAERTPAREDVQRLSFALGFPLMFFYGPEMEELESVRICRINS